jgi:hypothetical protein
VLIMIWNLNHRIGKTRALAHCGGYRPDLVWIALVCAIGLMADLYAMLRWPGSLLATREGCPNGADCHRGAK